jgi:hypothetical protein
MTNDIPQLRRTLVAAANRLYHEDVRVPSGSRASLRRPARLRSLILGGTSGVLAATVAAALLLSAGSAPTAAQALPILATRATPVAALADHASLLAMLRGTAAGNSPSGTESNGTSWPTSWGPVHEFSVVAGYGYVVQSSDGGTLCVVLLSAPDTTVVYAARACAATPSAQQQGVLLTTSDWTPGDYNFVALVPTGGTVTLADDGTTTNVPVDASGIAAGVVHDNATVSLHVGSSVQTLQLGPSAQTTPPGPGVPATSATPGVVPGGSTTTTGPTSAATGATS